MTRKQFIAMAEAIKEIPNLTARTWAATAAIAAIVKTGHPAFNITKFRAACDLLP